MSSNFYYYRMAFLRQMRYLSKKFDMSRLFNLLMGIVLLAAVSWVVNTIWYKPFSISTFFERSFFEHGLLNPEELTEHHAFEKVAFNGYERNLDDLSLASWKEERRHVKWNFDMLKSYAPEDLSEEERLSQQVLEFYWEMSILLRYDNKDSYLKCHYPIDQIHGAHIGLIDFLINKHEITDLRDAENYYDRLRMGRVKVLQARDNLELFTPPPSFILQKVIWQIDDFLALPIDENILYKDFQHKLDFVSGVPEEAKVELTEGVKDIISRELLPAYQLLREDLSRLLEHKHAEEDTEQSYSPSIKRIVSKNVSPEGEEDIVPIGMAHYSAVVKYQMGRNYIDEVDLDVIAREVDEELEMLKVQAFSIFDSLGIKAEGDMERGIALLSREEGMLYEDGNYGHRMLLQDMQHFIMDANQISLSLFGLKPYPLEVRHIVAQRTPYIGRFLYYPASLDSYRKAKLFVNFDSLSALPKFMMPAMLYFYASPGMHLVQSEQRKHRELPSFRRASMAFAAHREGWAFYANRLLASKGKFSNPKDYLGLLLWEIRLCTMFMAEYYLHQQEWGYDEAIEYVHKTSGMPRWEATSIVDQVAVEPGRAYSFWSGYKSITSLKRMAQKGIGEHFNEYEFHQELLRHGTLPLSILESVMKKYISDRAVHPFEDEKPKHLPAGDSTSMPKADFAPDPGE